MNDPTQLVCPKAPANPTGDNITHHMVTTSTGVTRCRYCRKTRSQLTHTGKEPG